MANTSGSRRRRTLMALTASTTAALMALPAGPAIATAPSAAGTEASTSSASANRRQTGPADWRRRPVPAPKPVTPTPKPTPTAPPTTTPIPAPTPAPATSALRVGIAYGDTLVWMSDARLAAALDDAKAVGAKWVRADLSWANIQDDAPDRYNWPLFDRVVSAVTARGLTVLPVLAYTPPWARAAGCATDKCPPADPKAFATFAGAAARRYAPQGIHTWEVWNEPNLTAYWKPAPNAAAYTALLKETSTALRAADSSAFVLLGGLAATKTTNGQISQTDFLAAVSARGGNLLVNAVGYHPYTYPSLASADTSWGTTWERIERTPVSLRSVLTTYGTPKLPVWVTETGAPTNGPGTVSNGAPATDTTTHVTEALQASIAADVVRTAAANPLVGAVVWYADRDLGTDRSTSENFFGLRRADGSAKPSFAALRGAVSALTP